MQLTRSDIDEGRRFGAAQEPIHIATQQRTTMPKFDITKLNVARLGISPATVRNHMIQALKKLREYFKSYPDVVGCILLLAPLFLLLKK